MTSWLAVLWLGLCPPAAWALITGGEGNEPLHDPGWPTGAAAAFNHPSRVAYWEGPPFGGGQYHAECRGDAAAVSEVLKAFAAIETPRKRVVLVDGVGHSFWLAPNREPEKRDAARIDWTLMVWVPDRLRFQEELPAQLRAVASSEGPLLAELTIHTGGNIRWEDVVVPEGLTPVDRRLEAHGHQPTDGHVLEGSAIDLVAGKPLAATLLLEGVQPSEQGGYQYPVLAKATATADGRWILKNAPSGRYRLVISADGYVPRVIGYGHSDGQPGWSSYDSGLLRPTTISGRTVDPAGQPLAGVTVHIDGFQHPKAARYELPSDIELETDADGRYHSDAVPLAQATVWVRKPGYVRPGLGEPVHLPVRELDLELTPAAAIRITVDFGDRPVAGYVVQVMPEGGEAVGKWSASGELDSERKAEYREIPPGVYIVTGRPNPGGDDAETAPVRVELKPGETTAITIKAR